MTTDKALRNVRRARDHQTEMRRRTDAELRQAILDARTAGATLEQIGDVIDMSHVAVLKILNAPIYQPRARRKASA